MRGARRLPASAPSSEVSECSTSCPPSALITPLLPSLRRIALRRGVCASLGVPRMKPERVLAEESMLSRTELCLDAPGGGTCKCDRTGATLMAGTDDRYRSSIELRVFRLSKAPEKFTFIK